MTNITLLEKAREGRTAALESLKTHTHTGSNVVSLFDFTFEAAREQSRTASPKVFKFHSSRAANAQKIAA